MKNSIEETKKQLELILKVRKEQKEIIECAGGSCMNCDPDIKALSKSIEILSDYKRVLKENEELNSKIPNLEQGTEILMGTNTKLTNELNDSISKKKIKDIIERIDYDIKKTKEIISNDLNIYTSNRRNDYQIVRLRAMNTKSLDIKKRLQELLESEE